MANYRLLSLEELEELEKEFIEFLIINGIEAHDWEAMKKDSPKDAERVIALFSDVVFEKILRTISFMDWKSAKELRSVQCLDDRFVVVGINGSNVQNADFTDPHFIKEAMVNPPDSLKSFTTEITYKRSRESEIFDLLEKGYQKSDGKLFKTICLILPG